MNTPQASLSHSRVCCTYPPLSPAHHIADCCRLGAQLQDNLWLPDRAYAYILPHENPGCTKPYSLRRVYVLQDEFYCHAHNRDGLVGIVFVDKEYPVRSAFCVVNKVCPLSSGCPLIVPLQSGSYRCAALEASSPRNDRCGANAENDAESSPSAYSASVSSVSLPPEGKSIDESADCSEIL